MTQQSYVLSIWVDDVWSKIQGDLGTSTAVKSIANTGLLIRGFQNPKEGLDSDNRGMDLQPMPCNNS